MANLEYTEMQLKIISGEIPIETVNGKALHWFYQKALDNNDLELAQRIQIQREVLRNKYYERNKQRARDRDAKIRHNEKIQWKQPKSNEYTVYEKQIVRGEIPYEDVRTNNLISIHLKAHNNGDYELSERVLDLINTRRQDAAEREKQYLRAYKNTRRVSNEFDSFYTPGDRSLSKWEQAVLMGFVDLDDCTYEQLQHILYIVKKENDAVGIVIINKLMLYKKDPEAVYIVRDHKEAVDMIEALLGLPIRRPETWFTEDE